MKKSKQILALAIIALLGLSISYYIYNSVGNDPAIPNIPKDTFEITNVYMNATKNAVFVDVISTTKEDNVNCTL